jgi:hypothetical protein
MSQDPDYWNPQRSPLLNNDYKPLNFYYDEEADADLDLEELASVSPSAPATLTDVPTSSLNAARPRTVAAGYDANRQTLTVVFRDGTIYNYYEISEGDWQNFHASISKGRGWLNAGGAFIGKPQGPADMTGMDPDVSEEVYRYARSAQLKFASKRRYKGASGEASVRRVSKTAISKAKKANSPSLGKNNPTANKPRKSK